MVPTTIRKVSSQWMGYEVEVMLEMLEGIELVHEHDGSSAIRGDMVLPHMTATVAFSGSASRMEIGSSAVCAMTGHLMIESDPITFQGPAIAASIFKQSDASLSKNCLRAEWKSQENVVTEESEQSPSKATKPHVVFTLPSRNSTYPVLPLAKVNRDSKIVKACPNPIQESETKSTASLQTTSTVEHDDESLSPTLASALSPKISSVSPARSASAIWSNSGNAMPEILELSVCLKSDDMDIAGDQAMAFLVMFGHDDDKGTFKMDLPLRKHTNSSNSIISSVKKPPSYRLIVTEESFLRVRVQINAVPSDTPPTLSQNLSSPTVSHEEEPVLQPSQTVMEQEWGMIMEKLIENERSAMNLRYAQKRAMDVEVPVGRRAGILPRPEPDAYYSCNTWNWSQIIDTLTSAVTSCEPGTNDGILGVPESGSSVASTIATRDSWAL